MGLYERLKGVEEPKLSVHRFVAAAAEVARGKVSATTAANALGLSQAERTEANTLITLVQNGTLNRPEVHDVLLLLEAGDYSVAQTKTRLGV